MKCFSCGAEVEDITGESHAYMLSTPGCWKIYQSILQKEYSDPRFFKANQYTVDAYAVQHYGKKEVPQAVSSVGIHLSSLYLLLNNRIEIEDAARFKNEISKHNKQHNYMIWLEPPTLERQLTINDLISIENPDRHVQVATEWAQSVWDAWFVHHDIIEEWVSDYLSIVK